MNTSKNVSTADVADRHRQYFALAMLAAGLIYLVKAMESLVTGPATDYLEYAAVILVLFAFGVLVPACVAKFRLPADEKIVYFRENGVAAQLLRRSFKVSWASTFISLVALEVIAGDAPVDLPADFFVQIGLFIMLAVMSITFLLLNWSVDRDFSGDEA